MKALAAALGLALPVLSAVEGLAAQDQQPPKPTFKSAVDLVPVDVSVIDKSGRPVPDLAAGDFTLTVDGKPRRIASAQFISVDRAVDSEPPSPPAAYNSNAGAQGGRLVMIAVASSNIGVGRGKAAIDAAKRFVGTLNRADRVALVTLPGAGPQIEFTSNHLVVQAMLDNVVGQATDNSSRSSAGRRPSSTRSSAGSASRTRPPR
jgi:VWFA-related protein